MKLETKDTYEHHTAVYKYYLQKMILSEFGMDKRFFELTNKTSELFNHALLPESFHSSSIHANLHPCSQLFQSP